MTSYQEFYNDLCTRGILADMGEEEFQIKEPISRKYLMTYLPDDPFEAEKAQTMAMLYADKIGATYITDRHHVDDPKHSQIIFIDMLSLYDNAVV